MAASTSSSSSAALPRAVAVVPPPHIAGAKRAPRLRRESGGGGEAVDLLLRRGAGGVGVLPQICAEPGPELWRALKEDGAVIWRRGGSAAPPAAALDEVAVAGMARAALGERLSAASLPVRLDGARSGSTDPTVPDTMPATTKDTPHADGQKSYLQRRPDIFMLACERPAASGGENYLIDAAALADRLVRRHTHPLCANQADPMCVFHSTLVASLLNSNHSESDRRFVGTGRRAGAGVDGAGPAHYACAPAVRGDRGN